MILWAELYVCWIWWHTCRNGYILIVCLCPLSSWSVTIHSFVPSSPFRPFFFSLWSIIRTFVSLGGCHVLFSLTLIWYHWFDLKSNQIKYPLKSYRFLNSSCDTWYVIRIIQNHGVSLSSLYEWSNASRRKCVMIRW